MTEHEALQVMLVKSFDAQATEDQFLSESDRREALREAIDKVGSSGTPDAFIAARAAAASRRLAQQAPAVKRILEGRGWHVTLLLAALAIGIALGITADVFGGGNRINLLAPAVWLVILWNLVVYFSLFGTLFTDRSRISPARTSPDRTSVDLTSHDWKSRLADTVLGLRFRSMAERIPSPSSYSRPLADFTGAWLRASAPLTTIRLVTLLHVASAAVALGLIAGMYYRGIVADYRVEWGSTFLEAQTVRNLLSILLSPALLLSGIQLPDVSQIEALRNSSNLPREQATAAPWIHLYAVMLMITVVLPRALLACRSCLRAHRLSVHFPLPLDDSYFRSILRMQRGETTRLNILPYGQSLTEVAEQNLRRILQRAFDDAAKVQLAQATALAEEDNRELLVEKTAHATRLVAVFDLTATPEAENHAVFIRALEESKLPVTVIVNVSNFVGRFGRSSERFIARQAAWENFSRSIRKKPLFFDLAEPQLADYVNALKLVIDEPAST